LTRELLYEAQSLLETRIGKLEKEKSKLEGQLSDPEFYADSSRSSKVIRMFEQTDARISATMSRWEKIASLQEV